MRSIDELAPSVWRLAPLLTAALLASFSCVSDGVHPAFTTTPEEFFQRHRAVCIAPVAAPAELRDERAVALGATIVGKLRDAGFRAPSIDDYSSALGKALAKAAGCFDPTTGEPEQERCTAQDRYLRGELQATLDCTAFLKASVVRVAAPWRNGIAFWDGTRDSLRTGVEWEGYAPALSLWIDVTDIDGAPLYWRSAGIELAVRLRSPTARRWDPVPVDRQLIGDVRLLRAVLLALGPLAGAPSPEIAECTAALVGSSEHGVDRDESHARAQCEYSASRQRSRATE